ncbi:protein DCL, chloroplastic-like [Dorcoceras hygrometricum]|uniref:Protein DCL, chloroplastic-like n=1 Tax=Dorcoceras hygrometricum TaxID=472368 RepID=A0A2Z7D7P4_9LAMI|nr:protein DCL, chloroplastic-like [Dorcoceras hygrometricum]
MALIPFSNSPPIGPFRRKSISQNVAASPFLLSFPLHSSRLRINFTVKAGSAGGGTVRSGEDTASYGSDFLRKPAVLLSTDEKVSGGGGDTWVDWEDQILEDTVPLVGFARMILHSGKYESGDRLSPEHEKIIFERLLAYHPEYTKKIGCGVDYITIGYHPNFEGSRCLFIVRKDGEFVDFSYWKCLKGLIQKNYPLYADSFILRHFRKRRRNY